MGLSNETQADQDSDGVGDSCDVCPADSDDQTDTDSDGVGDACDVCPNTFDDQTDSDGDGVGDACDVCAGTADNVQADSDNDGVGDACDVCPDDMDAEQGDIDRDGVGDECQCDEAGAAINIALCHAVEKAEYGRWALEGTDAKIRGLTVSRQFFRIVKDLHRVHQGLINGKPKLVEKRIARAKKHLNRSESLFTRWALQDRITDSQKASLNEQVENLRENLEAIDP